MNNSNNIQLLNDVLEQQKENIAPDMSDSSFFELFCADSILKEYNLTYEELESGITDGRHDGGIDAMYSFANGELIREDFENKNLRSNVHLEIHIIQAKTSGSFSETALNRLIIATNKLFDLSRSTSEFEEFNTATIGQVDCFRRALKLLAIRFPSLQVRYYYACKKGEKHIHPHTEVKITELKKAAENQFSEAKVDIQLLTASELMNLARKRRKDAYGLVVTKHLSAENGFIVLASLTEFANFLSRGSELKAELFEANVRDFEGSTEVNEEIAATLKDERQADFWWMNNGITILSNKATLDGDTLTIGNPQIVNGMQTSTQVSKHFLTPDLFSLEAEKRMIMIKVISSEDDAIRDKIIKATNSQNGVQPGSLRATDEIQRDIETRLNRNEIFYDRRKNFYKNLGKPASRIISISRMAQVLMTVIKQRPDNARARPSNLIKDQKEYEELFSQHFPINLYARAAALNIITEKTLRAEEMTANDRTNIKFYCMLWAICRILRTRRPTPQDFASIPLERLEGRILIDAIDAVFDLYRSQGGGDSLAKSNRFTATVIEDALTKL